LAGVAVVVQPAGGQQRCRCRAGVMRAAASRPDASAAAAAAHGADPDACLRPGRRRGCLQRAAHRPLQASATSRSKSTWAEVAAS
jgi:hypothetical protein